MGRGTRTAMGRVTDMGITRVRGKLWIGAQVQVQVQMQVKASTEE